MNLLSPESLIHNYLNRAKKLKHESFKYRRHKMVDI